MMRRTRVALSLLAACSLLMTVAGSRAAVAADALPPAVEALKAYRFGGDRAALDAVAAWVAESRRQPEQRKEAARALAALLQSDASFDAKQYACRQLVLVAGEEQAPVLAGLLADERLAHHALLVLERIPGERVSSALRRELSKARGGTLLGILGALGRRRDAQAVPLIAQRLKATDAAVAEAAADALGRIADRRAVQALRQAYESAPAARRGGLSRALLSAADALRRSGDAATAAAVYQRLDRAPTTPWLRAAALRGLVSARGDKALPLLLAALAEEGTPRQMMALTLAREVPGPQVTRALAGRLPKLPAAAQPLLLQALADRRDRAALPAVAAACRSKNAEVRLAALRALGALGDASSANLLLTAASTGAAREREVARASLVRLRGAGVDDRLLQALASAQAGVRAEAVRALGERRTASAIPRLLQAARSPQRDLSTAALRALREMGRPQDLPVLLDLLVASEPGDRDEALDAVAEIARRGEGEEQRTAALLRKLSSTSRPADRADLLSLLGQVGGPRALEALRSALADRDAEARLSAITQLAEWPTGEPLEDLRKVARSTQDAQERALALRGALRLAGLGDRPPSEALSLYREMLDTHAGPEEKRLVLSGLARLRCLEGLEYARGFLADEAVRGEAELAVVEVAQGLLGAYPEEARAALEPLAREGSEEAIQSRARAALALLDKRGDFVTAWEVSPAYQQSGADCSRLFDLVFPPEKPEEADSVPWRPMPALTNPEQPWLLDLLALWGGEQRVAYLRTHVWSDQNQDLVLELGSDDGVKVWWNGQVAHASNVQRAVEPAQEKVKLQARRGWNPLMLKVTQNVMGWGAVARFTHPDGSPAAGLRYALSPPASEVAGG